MVVAKTPKGHGRAGWRNNLIVTHAIVAGTLLGLGIAETRADIGSQSTQTNVWRLEKNSGSTTVADTTSRKAGSLQGDATWVPGLAGEYALRLPGTAGSFVDVAVPVIDTSRSYTVTADVKLRDVSGFQTFVSIDGDRSSAFYFQIRDDTGEFALTVPSSDRGGGPSAMASSHVEPDPNVWYHLTAVHDADKQTISLYVNGALQETVPATNVWQGAGHTLIGRGKYDGRPVDFVKGDIDDVRLYNTALPATEIEALAKADLPPSVMSVSAATLPPAALAIHAGKAGPRVNPLLYGLMTEEINYSYDGGLYAELIRNRQFRDNPKEPVSWSVVTDGGGQGTIALDTANPLNAAQPVSLKLTIASSGARQSVGAANSGYWGIPIKPGTEYRASFYARAAPGFAGSLMVSLESADGSKTFAHAGVAKVTGEWTKYYVTLKTPNPTPFETSKLAPTTNARFVISASHPGTIWLSLVSLFPPTYKNRPNGNRIDLMEKLAAMHHRFIRLPGGNYLEGNTIAERFDWKKTIGPIVDRPGHQGPWGYRSTDGMGLMEFLLWCEDLKMEPVLAVYAGYALNHDYVKPGADLAPYVQDALDEIEYLTGDAKTTKWGTRRAADGHPAPFPLHYVEVGNEDGFDGSGSYDGRFAQFYDAIKAKYPHLQVIATAGGKDPVGRGAKVTIRQPDLFDEHYYQSPRAMERNAHQYDTYDRKGPKIFVGEWASQDGKPTPNLNSALGDAAWMTGMERNSDVVAIESYAPLLVNVNPGGSQWGTNLIGYDALGSYASPSYYAQAMFASHVGDVVVPATLSGKQLFQSITRDTKTGIIYVKVVNAAGTAQTVDVTVDGVRFVASTGQATTLRGSRVTDTNSLADPMKVVPMTSAATGLGVHFRYTFPAYSITVLQMRAK